MAKSPSSLKILIVDDDALQAELLERQLRKRGVASIEKASSAEEGMKKVRVREYDLIFLDNYFLDSKEEGGSFWSYLYRAISDCYLVGVSFRADKRDDFFAQGAQDFLAKPIEGEDIERVLKSFQTQAA